MMLGRYRLLAQIGAGADGASYRASDPGDESLVEVRVLTGARADASRWKTLAKRLRLVAMLEHPAALTIRALDLEHDPPYLAQEWSEPRGLTQVLQPRLPLPPLDALRLARDCATVLAGAHRLGLVHGRLGPGAIRLADNHALKIDFSGIAANPGPDEGESALEASCRAPEHADSAVVDAAADVYGLGALLAWLLTGRPVSARAPVQVDHFPSLNPLLRRLLATDPTERPPIREVLDHLTILQAATQQEGGEVHPEATDGIPIAPAASAPTPRAGGRLGRFRLVEMLGEGGLGKVFRAEDIMDETVVAIKVLHDHLAGRPAALRRFRKEARLLAEVSNPYVANLIEVNEDQGVHYLVLEFVAGQSLGQFLAERRQLDERFALAVMADVARALVDAHRRGIVHRDIKPDNIILVSGGVVSGEGVGGRSGDRAPTGDHSPLTTHHLPLTTRPRVKLGDFGLARHVVESASLNVTHEGSAVGTVLYMSPEQAAGRGSVDARSDIYGMGATLFHLLAGRPPFLAESPLALSLLHANEPPPPLQKLNPAVSDGTCEIVAKALAKQPEARYADAEAILLDLERVLRGEPTGIALHPRLPPCDPRKLFQFDWTWDLEASPEQLWPYVSNTERLNRAVGLPAVEFTTEADAAGIRRFGKFRKAGFTNVWREHPFEWVEGERMGVLREYSQGVFRWLASTTELRPRAGGGTTLTHQVRIEPRGLIGRFVATVEVGARGRRSVERVYRRIDAFLTGKLGTTVAADPFEESAPLSPSRRQRLDHFLGKLLERQVEPGVVYQLGEFLWHAAEQEVARIRPLALAQRLGLDADQVVAACLHGAREGLLILLWDILCPLCRIPSEVKDTLRALREHGHCEACNNDFVLDFANSVELIFRVHPEIRRSELGTYCVGGPVHSPHVAAQMRVGPGERVELALRLSEGSYRLRGPQLPYACDFRVQPTAALTRWDLSLARAPAPESVPTLRAGRQLIVLANDHTEELLVRIERTASRGDALTAARASALALFRELFPSEVLTAGQLVNVAAVTLLATDLGQAGDLEQPGNLYARLGDAGAFTLLHKHFQLLGECVGRAGGALVKTVGEGALAAFSAPAAAVRAGLEWHALLAKDEELRNLRPRLGVHRGPAFAATVNDQLDYFGTAVNQAMRLPQLVRGGEMVLSQPVASDPHVVQLLRTHPREIEVLEANLPGQPEGVLHRLILAEKSNE
jgi:serine/threonine protein kinase/class 3 adenylate cyclase